MADTRNIADPMEETVEITLPFKDQEDSVYVSVNGENCRIMRGEPVKIKRKFLEVLNNAAKQEMAAHKYMQKAQAAATKPSADM